MLTEQKETEIYNSFLRDSQLDMKRYIASLRKPFHILSVDEILAETNYQLLKYKDSALKNKECLTEEGFKKLFCGACKNLVRWTADGVSSRDMKYNQKKVNNNPANEKGECVFDLVCESISEEDSFHKELNRSTKIKNIQIWIEEYSDFLTENELFVFKGMSRGLGVNKLAEQLGITHQAVTITSQSLRSKIKHYVKTDLKPSSDSSDLSKSLKSIKRLFDK